MQNYYKELIQGIIEKKLDIEGALKFRRELARKYNPKVFPSLIQIICHSNDVQFQKLKHLITKPTRTISGVSVIAIMTKPIECPHGKCLPCPGGPESFFGEVPQSYTGNEPATMRAIRNLYDPYLQVFNRLQQYVLMDRVPDKIELIIMGGTFPSFPKPYQEEFVKYAFKAMNDFGKMFYKKDRIQFEKFKKFFELPGNINDKKREENIKKKTLKLKKKCNLRSEQNKNEKAKLRCIGLCIETRSDFGKLEHGHQMLKLGCTRVEIGIQSVYDKVLKRIKRGHTAQDTKDSIKVLKDLGFKISGHYMPGLPGVNMKKDLDGMRLLFDNPDYRPDMLKIYPCIVLSGTKLYEKWKKGRYKPLTTEQAVELITEFKKTIPVYCRIQRIQRDIPSNRIAAGVDKTNLRQYIQDKCKTKCRCIRCREAGHVLNKNRGVKIEKIQIKVYPYNASKGDEFFISAEDVKNDILFGYCRLRFPSQILRPEITEKSALIRELHIYSSALQIGKTSKDSFQHRGLGKKLLETAEKLAREHLKKKVVIISGIGAREYFRKQGYKKEGPYMGKRLQ